MHCDKLSATCLKSTVSAPSSSSPFPHRSRIFRLGFSARICSDLRRSSRFKVIALSQGDKWKLNGIDSSAVQEQVNTWFSKTQDFLSKATSPLIKNSRSRKPVGENTTETEVELEFSMAEQTLSRRTPNGFLSMEAVVAVEQFSRMSGLTGQKIQRIFKALVPGSVYEDSRNLIEYCCFRFLSRDTSSIHPSLKEPAFQKLLFITMLAWSNQYCEEDKKYAYAAEKSSFQSKRVTEAAFIRIAPAIPGVADCATVHNLFKALADGDNGVSLTTWLTYINELVKVDEERKSYQMSETQQLSQEKIICVGSSRKRPVLRWENNMAWPGKVILTDKAIYFEAVGSNDTSRFDLTREGLWVEKAKVGPFGSSLFDSAISVSCGYELQKWVLEFIDLGGESRRDVWHAFINEVTALHKFKREYGPEDGDESMSNVFGAKKGKERATISAINSITRLQVLRFMKKLLDDPTKLVQFSYLQSSPYGKIVCQTLAVNFWSGPLVTKLTEDRNHQNQQGKSSSEVSAKHVFDIDGGIYLQKWMRSSSWVSSASIAFWKYSSIRQGLVLSKTLVVADDSLMQRAVNKCRQKSQVVEKTQATIDAAMLQGIPTNIDLFKEIMLPLAVAAKNFDKLRKWEEPLMTVYFLAFTYTIIFRNMLSYVFPVALIVLATAMLTLKGLKEQGRLGRSFGKVSIRDQPPSNTIQKILALKDAMRDVENFLQNVNVILLKIRTIVLSGHPQITTEVALVLFSSATILLIFPFKYVLGCFIFELFTKELEFRRETVKKFMSMLNERWKMLPAAPVVVLPYENDTSGSGRENKQLSAEFKPEKKQNGGVACETKP